MDSDKNNRKALKIIGQLTLKSILCQGVHLDSSSRIQLRLCLLGFHTQTRLLPARFPVHVCEKFTFERTFPLCVQPAHVFSNLEGDKFALDLAELSGENAKVLSTFRSDVNEFLFGIVPHAIVNVPQMRYYDLRLENSSKFSGKLHPVVSVAVKVALIPVDDPLRESKEDNAFNLTLGVPASEHKDGNYYQNPLRKSRVSTFLARDDIPRRPCQRNVLQETENPCQNKGKSSKRPFVVRHVDEKLIGRVPAGLEEDTPILERSEDRGVLSSRQKYVPVSRVGEETVSSILRRKPKVRREETKQRNGAFIDNWCQNNCSGIRREESKNNSGIRDSQWPAVVKSKSLEGWTTNNEDQSEDISGYSSTKSTFYCSCYVDHHTETCTICRLYRKYFGENYPNHE